MIKSCAPLLWIFLAITLLVRIGKTVVSAEELQLVDGMQCNSAFPFGFTLPQDAVLVDWTMGSYDNQDHFVNQTGLKVASNVANAAFLYSHNDSFYVGVTYEIEKKFKWLRRFEVDSASEVDFTFGAITQFQINTPILPEWTGFGDGFDQPTKYGAVLYVLHQTSADLLQLTVVSYLTGDALYTYKFDQIFDAGSTLDRVFLNFHEQMQKPESPDEPQDHCLVQEQYTDVQFEYKVPPHDACQSTLNNLASRMMIVTLQSTSSGVKKVREARFLLHSVERCDGDFCKKWKNNQCIVCSRPKSLENQFTLVKLEERDKYGDGQFYDVELLGIAKAPYLQEDINSDEGAASAVRVHQYGFQKPECIQIRNSSGLVEDLMIGQQETKWGPFYDTTRLGIQPSFWNQFPDNQQQFRDFYVYSPADDVNKFLTTFDDAWDVGINNGTNFMWKYKSVRFFRATVVLKTTGTTYKVSYAVDQRTFQYNEVKTLTYEFTESMTRTGHAVSVEIPQLVMTFSDGSQTHLYLDNMQRGVSQHTLPVSTDQNHKSQTTCCCSETLLPDCSSNTCQADAYKCSQKITNSRTCPDYGYFIPQYSWERLIYVNQDWPNYKEVTGLNKFRLYGNLAVIATTSSISEMRVVRDSTRLYMSTIVLRDLGISGKFYVYQIRVPPPVSSYDSGYEFTPPTHALLSFYTYTLNNLPLSMNLSPKVFLNSQKGTTPGQEIYFYAVASDPTTGDVQTETNADFMNCNKVVGTFTSQRQVQAGGSDYTIYQWEKDRPKSRMEANRAAFELAEPIDVKYSEQDKTPSNVYEPPQSYELRQRELCRNVDRILLMDSEVMDGVLCVEVNPNSKNQRFVSPQANIAYSDTFYGSVTDATYNIFPYSQCGDRSANPYYGTTGTTVGGEDYFGTWFSGQIYDPRFYISRAESQVTIPIRFQTDFAYTKGEVVFVAVNPATNYLYLEFTSKYRYGYGLLKPLEFTYNLGLEISHSWEQQLLLLDSCVPQNLELQLLSYMQDDYPLSSVYYFMEGEVAFEFPPLVVTNEYMNKQSWDIDKGNARDISYNIEVFINGTLLNMGRLQYFWFTANSTHLMINALEGSDQIASIGIRAVSQNPYYYMDPTTRKMESAFIELNLPQFLNVEFVNNLAPYFLNEINGFDFTLPLQNQIIIDLPEIIDKDSAQAYIESYAVTTLVGEEPCESFVTIYENGKQVGNKVVVQVKDIEYTSCEIGILLVDVMRVPRRSGYTFKLNFLSEKTVITEDEIDLLSEEGRMRIKVNNDLRMVLTSVDGKGIVTFTFNFPMSMEVNPLYFSPIQPDENRLLQESNTTVASKQKYPALVDQLQSMVRLTHTQENLLQETFTTLPTPTISVNSYDGVHLAFQINFPKINLLSKDTNMVRDLISLEVNDLKFLLSANNEMTTEELWSFSFEMPPLNDLGVNEESEQLAQVTTFLLTSVMSSSVFINFILATSMNELWGQLNILQMVVTIPLLQIEMPRNSLIFWSAIIEFAMFDVLDGGAITNDLIGEDAFGEQINTPRDEKFEFLRFDTQNYIYNVGTMFYVILFSFLAFFLSMLWMCATRWCMSNAFCCCFKRIGRNINKSIANRFQPAFFLRLFLEVNFDLIFSGTITLQAISLAETGWDKFMIFLAAVGVLLSLVVPILSMVIITCLHMSRNLRHETCFYLFGELYEPFTRRSHDRLFCLMYNVVYMVRRAVMVFIVFWVKSVVSFQIGITMFLSILIAGNNYQYKPFFESPLLGTFDLLNEIWYYCILALSFGFTLYNESVESRLETGKRANQLLGMMIALNCGLVIVNQLRLFYRLLYRRYKHWRMRRTRRLFLSKTQKKLFALAEQECKLKNEIQDIVEVFRYQKSTHEVNYARHLWDQKSNLFVIHEEEEESPKAKIELVELSPVVQDTDFNKEYNHIQNQLARNSSINATPADDFAGYVKELLEEDRKMFEHKRCNNLPDNEHEVIETDRDKDRTYDDYAPQRNYDNQIGKD